MAKVKDTKTYEDYSDNVIVKIQDYLKGKTIDGSEPSFLNPEIKMDVENENIIRFKFKAGGGTGNKFTITAVLTHNADNLEIEYEAKLFGVGPFVKKACKKAIEQLHQLIEIPISNKVAVQTEEKIDGIKKSKSELLEDVAEFNQNDESTTLYFHHNIPEKKLKNAKDKYCPDFGNDEDVLLLYDNTVLASAKSGFLISTKYIYQNLETDYPRKTSLTEIESLDFNFGGSWSEVNHVVINGEKHNLTLGSKDDHYYLIKFFEKITGIPSKHVDFLSKHAEKLESIQKEELAKAREGLVITYDKFKEITSYETNDEISFGWGSDIKIWPRCIDTPDGFGLSILLSYTGEGWVRFKNGEMIILADNTKIVLSPEEISSTGDARTEEDVNEVVLYSTDYRDFKKLADASKVEIQASSEKTTEEYTFGEDDIKIFRNFFKLLFVGDNRLIKLVSSASMELLDEILERAAETTERAEKMLEERRRDASKKAADREKDNNSGQSNDNDSNNEPEAVDVKSELNKYKEMLDDGLITQEDYNAKKKELLGL